MRRLIPGPLKGLLRPLARRVGWAAPLPWPEARRRPPWSSPTRPMLRAAASCNICLWHGDGFLGSSHSESARCPRCGSIARDRFLFAAVMHSGRKKLAHRRVLEMSPRLGEDYRLMMRRWFAYRSSDFDLKAHRADVVLDLENLTLPEGSVDVLLSAHVLEHIPDTTQALANVHRLLSPAGTMFLQVPLLQGKTAPPAAPEFHEDDTPVFWRFGWDLADQLRHAGFGVTAFVTEDFRSLLVDPPRSLAAAGEFDVPSIAKACPVDDLSVLLTTETSRRLGIAPSYQFAVWRCDRI